MKNSITVRAIINASVNKVWKLYTGPEHIVKLNSASSDWHTANAENDLREGGKFLSRMEAKDGSAGFDFGGAYTKVKLNELIEYAIGETGREVRVSFLPIGEAAEVVVVFDPEQENDREFQQSGWQSILDNFAKYAENNP